MPVGRDGRRKCALVLLAAALLSSAAGSIAADPDQRQLLVLSRPEADALLRGMRVYLESIEGIITSMSANAMPKAAASARRSGHAMLGDVALTTALKLPPDFVLMSADTHRKFDELAESAERPGAKLAVMQNLSAILANCTSCHAMYRVAPH